MSRSAGLPGQPVSPVPSSMLPRSGSAPGSGRSRRPGRRFPPGRSDRVRARTWRGRGRAPGWPPGRRGTAVGAWGLAPPPRRSGRGSPRWRTPAACRPPARWSPPSGAAPGRWPASPARPRPRARCAAGARPGSGPAPARRARARRPAARWERPAAASPRRTGAPWCRRSGAPGRRPPRHRPRCPGSSRRRTRGRRTGCAPRGIASFVPLSPLAAAAPAAAPLRRLAAARPGHAGASARLTSRAWKSALQVAGDAGLDGLSAWRTSAGSAPGTRSVRRPGFTGLRLPGRRPVL